MKHKSAVGCLLAVIALAGCDLLSSPEGPRILEMAFRLEQRVDEGEKHLITSWAVPSKITLENRLLQVSGRIEAAPGAQLPAEVIVRTEITKLQSGALLKTFRLIVDRSAENPHGLAGQAR